MRLFLGLIIALFLNGTAQASPAELELAEPFQSESPQPLPWRLAQAGGDAYDPFVDYSEFEDNADEESDIHFFRNGRFFTLGFIGGYRSLTETLGNMYQASTAFGVFLSYFFDLRFALQLSFLTGDHPIRFSTTNGTKVRGNAGITSWGIDLKYYFNTQNVTRGLAQLNPYLIGGFSQITRTATLDGNAAFSKDPAQSFNIGAGIELPMMRNKMFFGAQGLYQLVTFRDENTEVIVNDVEPTGLFPTGDIFMALLILGVNF